jgi:hypothetical protein
MGAAQIILYILQGAQIVGTLFPANVEAALKLKSIFDVDGSDFTVQIVVLQDGAIKTAQESLVIVADWKKEHGYTD